MSEAIAIARAMSDPYTSRGIPGWIAFSCKDGHYVSSGETIIKCAEMIDKVRPITGIGINCTKPEYVESLIKDIRTVTDKPIAVYLILVKAMIVKLRPGMATLHHL